MPSTPTASTPTFAQATTSEARIGAVRSRLSEQFKFTTPLHQRTLFPYASNHQRSELRSATLAFRFRSIGFAKKRTLPFFLARELLAEQKAQPSLAQRPILA